MKKDDCGIRTVNDYEPLTDPLDPTYSTNPITVTCSLSGTSSGSQNYDLSVSVNSYSTNQISDINFDQAGNTLNVILNDCGAGNGSACTGSYNYDRVPNTSFVYVNITKSGQKVGKAKHKIIYCNI